MEKFLYTLSYQLGFWFFQKKGGYMVGRQRIGGQTTGD